MEDIRISKTEFLEFVTQGFPIELNETEQEEFFNAFTFYVNQDENDFIADLTDDGVYVHAGMKTEICKLEYNGEKLLILTKFNEKSENYSSEFTDDECRAILAMACQGIIVFTKTYAIATGKLEINTKSIPIEKFIDDNYKYKPWPITGA